MLNTQVVPDETVLEEEHVAGMLGVESSTLQRWRRENYGPPFSRLRGPRGRVRYLRSDVIAWLRSRQEVEVGQ